MTQVRAIICCPVVHNRVWELHTSAATPPSLLFSVASTTNLVGHVLGTSRSLKHATTLPTKCLYLPSESRVVSAVSFYFLSFLSYERCFVLVDSEPALGGDFCCSGLFVCFVIVFCFACSHLRISSTVDCWCLTSILCPSFAKLLVTRGVVANKTSTQTNPTQSNSTLPTQRNTVFRIFVWYGTHFLINIYPGALLLVSQRKAVFDAIVAVWWSVFGFHFSCMPSSVRMILFPVRSRYTVVLTL